MEIHLLPTVLEEAQQSKHSESYNLQRIFKKGDFFKNSSLGRVLVKKEHRRKDLGKTIMIKSIEQIKKDKNEKKIELSAQKYLLKFYLELGFKKIGEEYLEDGIPHVKMILKI